jgi:tetratricopeptide (TPR) repeat protein
MRLDIAAANAGNPRQRIWVAEQAYPAMSEKGGFRPMEIVDLCLDAIRNAERLFLVVDGSLGTRLTYEDSALVSSYVEMEIFQAVVERIPIYVFTIGDVGDDSPMANVLRFFAGACPRSSWQRCLSAAEAGQRIERLRESGGRSVAGYGTRGARTSTIAAFTAARFSDWSNERLGDEVEWLGGQFDQPSAKPDPALVASLLNDPRTPGRRVGTQTDLGRAWLALRSLMGVPYRGPASEYDVLWNRALGQWASAIAWYGLHAHIDLGHVAALGSLHQVRRKMADAGRSDVFAGHTASVHGAFGSCYYSLAKQCDGRGMSARSMRTVFMERAAKYVDAGLAAEPPERQAGLYALRGSIRLRAGMKSDAIGDYEMACRLSGDGQTGDAQYGERLSELGWAEWRAGRWRAGIAHQEEGLRLLAGKHGPGFEARARSKLAISLGAGLRLRGAFREYVTAYHLAKSYQMDDQIRPGMRTASAINDILDKFDLGVHPPDRQPPSGDGR